MRALEGLPWAQLAGALRTWPAAYWGWIRHGLSWASRHSGIPAIVLCAIALVVLYRIAKKSARFLAQVSVVILVLAVLAKLGILRF